MRKSMEREGEGGARTQEWGSGTDGKEKSVRVCACVCLSKREGEVRDYNWERNSWPGPYPPAPELLCRLRKPQG